MLWRQIVTNDKETDDEMMLTYFFDDGTTIPIYKTFRRSMALNRYLEKFQEIRTKVQSFFLSHFCKIQKMTRLEWRALKPTKFCKKRQKHVFFVKQCLIGKKYRIKSIPTKNKDKLYKIKTESKVTRWVLTYLQNLNPY